MKRNSFHPTSVFFLKQTTSRQGRREDPEALLWTPGLESGTDDRCQMPRLVSSVLSEAEAWLECSKNKSGSVTRNVLVSGQPHCKERKAVGWVCKSQMRCQELRKSQTIDQRPFLTRNEILALCNNKVETHIQVEVMEVGRNNWEMDSWGSCMNQLPFLLPNLMVRTEYYPLLPFPPPIH